MVRPSKIQQGSTQTKRIKDHYGFTISPGYIATDMVMAVPEDIRNKIIAGIPTARLGKPEEIAGLIGYLASDISGFMTGANLAINGGQHMC